MCWRSTLIAAACAIFAVGHGAAADSARIVGESRRTFERFAEADQRLRDGQVDASVELYLRIIRESGDELIADHPSGEHFAPARRLAHSRIVGDARLLEKFRARTENAAQKLLAEGLAKRDVTLLRQLVDWYFGSRETEAALHVLGDIACERGDFAAARRLWSQLIPNATIDAIHFPTAPENLPLAKAKLVVCRGLLGESAGILEEIERLEMQYPDAMVTIAGHRGKIGPVLREIVAQANLAVPSAAGSRVRIATFGSTESRNGLAPESMPLPAPTFDGPPIPWVDSVSNASSVGRQSRRLSEDSLATEPITVGRHAFVSDSRRIAALNLATRQWSAQFDLQSHVEFVARTPVRFENRNSVTVADNEVYARLGETAIRGDRAESDSYIVALRFQPEAKEPLRLRWLLPAGRAERAEHVVFEGAPIVHDGRLFVAATRMDGNRAITAVACYDPTGATPRLVWQHDAIDAGADSAERAGHLLLSAADGVVICGPWDGAIVAFDSSTGRRAWAYRYPTEASSKASRQNPCVVVDGIALAAPTDFDQMIALDLATGTPIWKSDPVRVQHVLGVASGKIVCQTSGWIAGVRAIDLATGRLFPHWGYEVFGSDAAAPFGRGLLFEDRVCWPTRAEGFKILNLDGSADLTSAVLRSHSAGNLAYADGRFVIAGPTHIQCLEADRRHSSADHRDSP